jgi:hypothetical protein
MVLTVVPGTNGLLEPDEGFADLGILIDVVVAARRGNDLTRPPRDDFTSISFIASRRRVDGCQHIPMGSSVAT